MMFLLVALWIVAAVICCGFIGYFILQAIEAWLWDCYAEACIAAGIVLLLFLVLATLLMACLEVLS